MAWNSALLHPERYRGVIGMSVPYTGRPAAPPLHMMRQAFAETFFYIVYFQDVGVAEKELEADPKRSMRLILYAASGQAPPVPSFAGKAKDSGLLDGIPEPEQLMPWLTEADLDYFAGEFKRAGFRGGINRYRNMDRDWEELPQLEGAKITQPSLFLAGDKDGVVAMNPAGIEAMKSLAPGIKVVMIPGAGHWTQQEAPDAVNSEMIAFLKELG
jgi:pimeloyl-ACP methyl ester carboxylesterase